MVSTKTFLLDENHDWEESDPRLKKTFFKIRHKYEQKRHYLRSHQRLLLNFKTNVEEEEIHDNSEGNTRGNGHINFHYKQGPVDLFNRKCSPPELLIWGNF